MPRKDRQRLTLSDKNCVFCGSPEDNEVKYGKIYRHNGIITHYYCLLLSSNMQQKGSDEEGILGFLKMDILDELRRGRRLSCSYCKRIGATLGCCNTKCKKIFHLPCGLKAGSLHQFFGEFRSYCSNHRPKQKIDDRISAQITDQLICYICYDNVEKNDLFETLWAPCCKKNAWFHRCCVQQLAMSAGYFFKCPLCNNKKEFQKAMLDNGIFIPCQDASWELVPNAFQELLYRHNRCDAGRCICSKGRQYTSSNPKWELILCRTCGSQGIHVACGRLKWGNATWDCRECTSILTKTVQSISEETRNSANSTPSVDTSAKDNCHSDESDSDISVGVEEPVYGPTPWPTVTDSPPQAPIRPGPRSFKLKQQKMLRELCDINSEGTSSGESSPRSELSRGNFVKNNRRESIPDSSTSSKADEAHKINSLSTEKSKSPAKTSTNAPEELVIVDSDEEILPEKLAAAEINENVLKTNNGLTIPVHHVPTPISNNLEIINDVKVPMTPMNLPIIEPTILKNAIVNQQSIGHIAIGSSYNPIIIGNIHMPPEPQPTSSTTCHSPSTSMPGDSIFSPALPLYHNVCQESEHSAMGIKITNVTSLPPEVFAEVSAPVSTVTGPEVVDVESDNEEISYQLSTVQQLGQTNFDGNQGIQVSREKRPAPATPERQCRIPHNNATSETILADPKRVRMENPSETSQATAVESPISSDKPYVHGVSLENAAIVNVMGKEYVVPLPDEPRVRVSSTWVPAYDGDAGTSPAEETTEPVTRCPSDRAGTMEIHGLARQLRALYRPISTDTESISKLNNPSIDARPNITTTSDYSNRLNVAQVPLKDLKFRITGRNTVKMTIRNMFTMNLDLDSKENDESGSKCETGPRKRNGSSLVRRSSSMTHDNRIKAETNFMRSPTRESNSVPSISKFTKSPERRKVNAIKENLAPVMTETNSLCYCQSSGRQVKRFRLDSDDSIKYETWQKHIKCFSNLLKGQAHPGTSRDGLKELSHSSINQRSEYHSTQSLKKSSQINHQESSIISDEKECLPISIDLTRIEPLLLSKPAFFGYDKRSLTRGLVKFNSLSDLRCYSSGGNQIETLRRTKSLNNLSSLSVSEFFNINISNRINYRRQGQKRKNRSFEKHDLMR